MNFKSLLLCGSFFVTFSSYAVQGMHVTLNSSYSDLKVSVDSSTCVISPNNFPINSITYIKADSAGLCLFKKSQISFSLKDNFNRLYSFTVNVAQSGSSLQTANYLSRVTENLFQSPNSQAVVIDNKRAMVATLYPHYGLLGTEDELVIDIEPKADNWQEAYSQSIAGKKLNEVLLPGSHDTGTYAITSQSFLTSDLPSPLLELAKGTDFMSIFSGWSKTQNFNVLNQLKLGVRYLDIRLCGSDYTGAKTDIYTCHGLSGAKFSDIVAQTKQFIENHPKEVVIFDLQHVYDLSDAQIDQLSNMFKNAFGQKIALSQELSPKSTYSQYWQKNAQIIILMSNENAVAKYGDIFWARSNISSPWPNTTDTSYLLNYMSNAIQNRASDVFFVLQSQETESTNDIVKGVLNPLGDNPKSLLELTTSYKNKVRDWQIGNAQLLNEKGNILIQDFEDGISTLKFLRKQYTVNYGY